MNKNDECCLKRTLWYSYVIDDKMRTNYSWKAVESILEMREIGESYHMVGVTHYVQFSNPGPLFIMDALNNEMTLPIGIPTLYSHYLIVRGIGENDDYNLNEPILEMGKIGKSNHRIGVTHFVQFWNPGPLFVPLVSLKKMICIQSGAWAPIKKCLRYLNLVIGTLPLSSFQNGLIEILTIIISDSKNNYVMTV